MRCICGQENATKRLPVRPRSRNGGRSVPNGGPVANILRSPVRHFSINQTVAQMASQPYEKISVRLHKDSAPWT